MAIDPRAQTKTPRAIVARESDGADAPCNPWAYRSLPVVAAQMAAREAEAQRIQAIARELKARLEDCQLVSYSILGDVMPPRGRKGPEGASTVSLLCELLERIV